MTEQNKDSDQNKCQDENPYSFDIKEEQQIIDCYNKHGIVVVRNVLTKAECKETFFDLDLPEGTDITKPETYHLMDNVVNRYGVYGSNPLFTKALLRNRTHQNVQHVFQLLYGKKEKLLVQHDRVGIMRPTNGQYGQEKWRVPDIHPNLHLDINIFGYYEPNYRSEVDKFLGGLDYTNLSDFVAENNAKHCTMDRQIQSVLNLVDNRYEDGGFHCIPLESPEKVLKDWLSTFSEKGTIEPNGRYIFSNNHKDDAKLLSIGQALRMPCPAGSLVLFDACLPHGTLPNFSDRIRVIQFLRYIPETVIINHKKRAKRVEQECKRVGFEINKDNMNVLLGTEI
jgi:hypothetical protein